MISFTKILRGSGRHGEFAVSFIVLLSLIINFGVSDASAAGRSNERSLTRAQRAANVQRELLEHQRRVPSGARDIKSRSVSAIPSGVSVKFDRRIATASTTFFYDDMENGTNGWTEIAPTDSAAWHLTTRESNSPTHSWWPGVESSGNYVTGARVYEQLISPAINLAGATGNVTLLFTENYFTERGWDYCMVDVSTDSGTTWTHLRGGYGSSISGDSYGWKVSTLDLTSYANETINLRFAFDTGDSLFNAFPGWFVDNVAVFDQSETVKGIVYYDQNQNGVHDTGEPGLAQWLVNITGPLTITMQTRDDGRFDLPLPLGSYQFSEVTQIPWIETSRPETLNVDVSTPGATVSNVNFGNYRQGCVMNGLVFEDLNKDSLYDQGDSVFTVPDIELSDSSGNWVNDTHADTTGAFSLIAFGSGRYQLTEYLPPHWVSTIPASRHPGYTVNVPLRDTVLNGYLFGSYFDSIPATSAIQGEVFDDLNRNGILDNREPPLEGWTVSLSGTGGFSSSGLTDSLGRFSFDNLVPGTYQVSLNGLCGWQQSTPSGNFTIDLDSGQVIDTLLFGTYALQPDTISGTVFNDLDSTGVREPADPPLSGFQIFLSGDGCPKRTGAPNVEMSAVSDSNGHFLFGGLWYGTYHVRIVSSTHWRQTYPASLQEHTVVLGNEQNDTAANFGMVYDSSFNVAFRSFLPESIAYVTDNTGKGGVPGKAEALKAIGSQTVFSLVTPISGLNGLHVEFNEAVIESDLTVSYFPAGTPDSKLEKWEFKLAGSGTLEGGDTVMISAMSNSAKVLYIGKYWWEKGSSSSPAPGTTRSGKTFGTSKLLLPMPNVMNVLQDMFTQGFPTKYGLTVGLVPGPHSAYAPSAAGVWQSLYQKGHVNLGPPRCLGIFATTLKPIKKSVNTLTPTQANNILFAEALTLKANIVASDYGITPYGFGNLIFQSDSANRFNGQSVRQIAALIDTAMSAFSSDACVNTSGYFDTAYSVIRMIDSAFSGPIDTVSFGTGLILTPVNFLSNVPFLTLDSNASILAPTTARRVGNIASKPWSYKLEQNYPNPFNPTTTLSFTLGHSSLVTLEIYNVLGQVVATPLNKIQMGAGTQEVVFNATNLASGVYFYRIRAEGNSDPANHIAGLTYVSVKKMVLMK
jgi:hypothetical protein